MLFFLSTSFYLDTLKRFTENYSRYSHSRLSNNVGTSILYTYIITGDSKKARKNWFWVQLYLHDLVGDDVDTHTHTHNLM